ncbi:MAG: acyl carrier protein [Acidimicrobiia bacterium]|jgi:acyl carrier protein|nr:acyl carrier protein [Acidimicrobiia bacterium]MBP8180713.1 acyl carrier protein [Acidimicrobiia bacterium]
MERTAVLNGVIKIAADVFTADPATIGEETLILEDLEADSLARVEFLMALEDEFDLVIEEEIASQAQTIGKVTDLVVEHLGANA